MTEWKEKFTFPDVTGQAVLLVGLGGGSDIISAFALGTLLPAGQARKVVYGNTKTREDRLERVTAHIGRVPAQRVELRPGPDRFHGTTLIDQSVPRGDDGCPWTLSLDDESAARQLAEEIRGLGFDLLFGVDTGGDSLASRRRGRDKRMLRILQDTGIPLFHVVVAPGSDGETSVGRLQQAFAEQRAAGRYRGCFSLAPALPLLESLSEALSAKRTPRIILAAVNDRLERREDRVVVPRGCKPVVPKEWLSHGFVFGAGGPAEAPA
jgi:Protein of unknown function (DUF1152)